MRRLRVLQSLTAVFFLGFVVAAGLLFYTRHANRPVAILVNGKTVSTVRSQSEAEAALAAAEREQISAAYPLASIVRMQRIQYQRMASDTPVDTDETGVHNLAAVLQLRVHAYVISVGGQPSIGLPTADAANNVLSLVRQHYLVMPPPGKIIGAPAITQAVTIVRLPVNPDRALSDPQAAAAYFWTPPPAKTYVVQLGDRGYNIAIKHHISFTDFLLANAGHDMNKLHPGDIVNIQRMPPTLTVIVKKHEERDEPILPHTPPAAAGVRHVIYVVTYTNGVETGRDIIGMTTLKKPTPRRSID